MWLEDRNLSHFVGNAKASLEAELVMVLTQELQAKSVKRADPDVMSILDAQLLQPVNELSCSPI